MNEELDKQEMWEKILELEERLKNLESKEKEKEDEYFWPDK